VSPEKLLDVTSSPLSDWGTFERSHITRAGLRAFLSAAGLFTLYYLVPVVPRAHESVALRLGAALALFAAVLVYEVRSIVSHDQPMLKAVEAMSILIPLFLVLFAWIYLTMSDSNPAAFGSSLDRTSALYFTVSVFSTVGFGDITPKTDVARLVVTVQMLTDLAVLAVVVRLIFRAASRGAARLRETSDPQT
jgi:hypothetical protein